MLKCVFNHKEPSPSLTAVEGASTIERDLVLNSYNVHMRSSSIPRVKFPEDKVFALLFLHNRLQSKDH